MTDVVSGARKIDAGSSRVDTPAGFPPPSGAVSGPPTVDIRFWWLGMPAAILGLSLPSLDQSLTSVSFTAMANDFGASNVDIQWVTTVNRIGMGISIPVAVWLARRFGLRRTFVATMVLYIVIAAGCGLAPGLISFAVFRFLEGFPAGLAAVVSIGVMIFTVPRDKLPIAIVTVLVLVLCAPGFGPVIGGLLVLDVQWRAIFPATVVIAVLALVASLGIRSMPPPPPPPRFDKSGFACLAVGIIALTLGVSKGWDWGWTSYPIVILFAVGVDALVLFVIVQRQTAKPLLDVRLFTDRTFNVGMVLTAVISIELTGILTFVPTFLKQVHGLSAIHAGIVMIPQALTLVIGVAVSGLLTRSWGVRPVMVTGLATLGVGQLLLTRITVDLPRPELATILSLWAAGLGLAFVPVLSAATSTLPVNLLIPGIQFRTMIQRVIAAVAVTYVNGRAAHRQRQILSDQSGQLGPADAPALYAQQQRSPTSLLPLWQQLKLHGVAQSHGEVFLVLGLVPLACILLVFTTRWGPPPRSDDVIVQDGA
jgi:EmrB/QacA subfamily drug resistance transporter